MQETRDSRRGRASALRANARVGCARARRHLRAFSERAVGSRFPRRGARTGEISTNSSFLSRVRTWTLRTALTFLRAAADLGNKGRRNRSATSHLGRAFIEVASRTVARTTGLVSSVISFFATRDRLTASRNESEPVFVRESARGTHLSWALTPASWVVAREEAMMTGGG